MDFNVDSFILLDVLCGKQGGGGRPFVHQIFGSNNVAITFPLVEIRMLLSNVAYDVFNASFALDPLEVMALMNKSHRMTGCMQRLQSGEQA